MTDATQLLPKLKPAEFEALKESIRRDGVIVPVVVRSNGDMIDGHHRRAIAEDLGVECPTKVVDIDDETADRWRLILNLARRHLEEWERLDMIAALVGPIYDEEVKKAKQRMADGGRKSTPGRPGGKGEESVASPFSRAPQARDVAAARLAEEIARTGAPIAPVSGKTVDKAIRWRDLGPDRQAPVKKAPAVGQKKVTTTEAIKQHQKEKRQEAKAQEVAKIAETPVLDLDLIGTYDVVYCDPPWRYEQAEPTRAIENHYPTMSLDELKAMIVPGAPDSVLFMWATSPKLAEALELMVAWGYEYRTNLVWVKHAIGMGYYARQRHELLLIGRRGRLPVPDPEDRPDSVIEAPRTRHSAKPDEGYEVIERMYPTRSRVELFARQRRDGWASWGNQA